MAIDEIEQYLQAIPESRRHRLESLQSLIMRLYPSAKVSFRYKMPTFEWQGGWVALGNQKNYISLYTCGAQHLATFKARHPRIKTGKGCINIKDSDAIPWVDLEDVIRHAMSAPPH